MPGKLAKNLLLGSLSAFVFANALAGDADQPFSGVFRGQGRGCWGKLHVTAKAIEWNTPYSVCNKTPFAVIQRDLHSKSPKIAFALDRKSKKCRYEVIEISFDPAFPDYWLASGYQSRKDFDEKTTPSEEANLRTLSCGVKKID